MADPALLQKLGALLSGSRYQGGSFDTGPVFGNVGQYAPIAPEPASGPVDPTTYSGLFGLSPNLGDIGGMPINATGMVQGTTMTSPQTGQGYSTLNPSIGLGAAPLNVTAGLSNSYSADGATSHPEFGASLRGQIAGGNAMLGGTISPNNYNSLNASYARQIDPQSEIALMLSRMMPQDAAPDTRFGIAYRRRF